MADAMGFTTVEEMWGKMPELKAANRREQAAEAAEKRKKRTVSATG